MALGLLPVASVHAQDVRPWRSGDRVLITAFHRLGAVTSDLSRVYAASPHGIQVYDHTLSQWEIPIMLPPHFSGHDPPSALAYDGAGDLLWVGTRRGELFVYHLHLQRWDSYGAVAKGPVLQLVPAQRHGNVLYVQNPTGWVRVQKDVGSAERVLPGQLPPEARERSGSVGERIARADPFFHALSGTLSMDDRLRRWPITDFEPAHIPDQYWVATDGGSLLDLDVHSFTVQPMSFGLLTRGSGAVMDDGGKLWFGGDGRGTRLGVSRSDTALQRWQHFEARYDAAPAGYVNDILPTSEAVWFAAEDGLFRFDRDTEGWWRAGQRDGLPGEEVLALAPTEEGVWAGTGNGLVAISDDGELLDGPFLTGVRVNRLVLAGDTLWLATTAGAFQLPASDTLPGELTRLPGTEEHPGLRGLVLDIRPGQSEAFLLTDRALYRFDGAEWVGPEEEALVNSFGRLHRMALADDQLWLAADRGVLRWDRLDGSWYEYHIGPDINEGPVTQILPAGDHVWVATPGGAMRLRWRR